MDFCITRGIGGQQVEINLGTGGEDEPTALGADAGINTELVELGTFGSLFWEIESGGYTNIPAMVIVLVDVAELDGNEDGIEVSGLLSTAKRVNVNCIVFAEEVTVGEVSVAIADADVEVPTFGNRTVIVEHNTLVPLLWGCSAALGAALVQSSPALISPALVVLHSL